jgi:membrane protease YdiL (CAAX protease family)
VESNAAVIAPTSRKRTAWYAVWLVLGYLFAQFVGSVLVGLMWGIGVGFEAALHGNKMPAHLKPGIPVLAWSITFGMLLGAVWVTTFTWRYAKSWLHEAGATGIAWRASLRRDGYGVAALLAVALVMLVTTVEHFLPPNPSQLTGPMQQLSTSHGLPHVLFIIMAVAIAPPLEEFIFRGVAFAAVARGFGTVMAVSTTTLAFVLLHAADKIHYWPGFLLVGCLALAAVFLRLRYRSLWPGILMHACYNGLLILLS